MQSVTFLKPFSNYVTGDTATFEDDRSNALIKAGVAVAYNKPVPSEKPKSKRVKEQETCQAAPAENLF